MKWSWRLGRLLGIDVFVHATFFILLAWVAMGHYRREGTWLAAAQGVAFISAVFAIVVLHELGHALTARRFGIQTKDITLLPIGGVARLERMPEKPLQELLVALAGPAVNVALAIGLWILLALSGQSLLPDVLVSDAPVVGRGGTFLVQLFWVNVVLAVFNLLPAFPMDGGRALRALLALRVDYVRATRTAAQLGQWMAILLGLLGLFTNPFLVLIAVFVWIGAGSEAGAVQNKALLQGIPVQAAMHTNIRVLTPEDSLSTAVQALLAGSQVDFPVVDETGALVGVLTRNALIRGLNEHGGQASTSMVMERGYATTTPGEMLEEALLRLQSAGCASMPVLVAGRVVGMVTMENIGELMLVRRAMGSARDAKPEVVGRREVIP